MEHRYMHVRVIDSNGVIQPHGGVTVAYMATPKDIFLHLAQCHSEENFVKKIGRAKASGRLRSRGGPLEVLTRTSDKPGDVPGEIAKWLATEYWGGVTITRNAKGQWVSDFEYPDFEETTGTEADQPVVEIYNVGDGEPNNRHPEIFSMVDASCSIHKEKAA